MARIDGIKHLESWDKYDDLPCADIVCLKQWLRVHSLSLADRVRCLRLCTPIPMSPWVNRLDALHTVTCMSHGVLILYMQKGPMISGRVTSSIWRTSRTWGSATCVFIPCHIFIKERCLAPFSFGKIKTLAFLNVLYLFFLLWKKRENEWEWPLRGLSWVVVFFRVDGQIWCDAPSQWEYPSGRWLEWERAHGCQR